MRKNSVKNTRINGEVLKELSNIIRSEIKDPRINPMTSVVAVEDAYIRRKTPVHFFRKQSRIHFSRQNNARSLAACMNSGRMPE